MSSVFSYYGGKQRMVAKIIKLIPPHVLYCEPFCGAATIFFTKPWKPNMVSQDQYLEVLNDTNGLIINFFRVLQDEELSEKLIRKLEYTTYSKAEYDKALKLSKDAATECLDIDLAWAFFVNIMMSFGYKLRGGYVKSVKRNESVVWCNKTIPKRLRKFAMRLKNAVIDNRDAVEEIERYDSPHTMFYCDPPYVNCCQAHYKGYGVDDYQKLIDVIERSKGSFVVSGYPNDYVPKEWKCYEFKAYMSVQKNEQNVTSESRERIECVWVIDRSDNIEPFYLSSMKKLFPDRYQTNLELF